jgi:hypothetical protein
MILKSARGCLCFSFLLFFGWGCSVYESQGRKKFEADSENRVKTELSLVDLMDSSPENARFSVETEHAGSRHFWTLSKKELAQLLCELPSGQMHICYQSNSYEIINYSLKSY